MSTPTDTREQVVAALEQMWIVDSHMNQYQRGIIREAADLLTTPNTGEVERLIDEFQEAVIGREAARAE